MATPPSAASTGTGTTMMAESSVRKACDRCHEQKLSCKRVGDERCDRCSKLSLTCKTGPSLRQKRSSKQHSKQLQQQQYQAQQLQAAIQQQQQRHQANQPSILPRQPSTPAAPPQFVRQQQSQPPPPPPTQQQQQQQPGSVSVSVSEPAPILAPSDARGIGTETMQVRSRSPKRRRKDSDSQPVPPDTGHSSVPPPPPQPPPPSQAPPPTPQHHHHHHLPEGGYPVESHIQSYSEPHLQQNPPPPSQVHDHNQLYPIDAAAAAPEKPQTQSMGEFPFSFDPLPLLNHNQQDYITAPLLPPTQGLEQFHHSDTQVPISPHNGQQPHQQVGGFQETWDQQPLAPRSHPFTDPSTIIPQSQINPSSFYPSVPPHSSSRQGSVLSQHSSQSRSHSILKSKVVALRQPGQLHIVQPISWMSELSVLHERLQALSTALPWNYKDIAHTQPLGLPTDSRHPSGFPMEEVFALTRQVADVFDRIVKREGPGSGLSAADSMFIFAIYMRLLEMYEHIFWVMHEELRHGHGELSFDYWKIPDVAIGQLVVDSTPSLQISLVIQLTQDFLTRLRGATAALEPAMRDGSLGFAETVEVSYNSIKVREDKLKQDLVDLQVYIDSLIDPNPQ